MIPVVYRVYYTVCGSVCICMGNIGPMGYIVPKTKANNVGWVRVSRRADVSCFNEANRRRLHAGWVRVGTACLTY